MPRHFRDGEQRFPIVGGPVETVDPIRTDQKMTVDSIAIVTVHDGPSLPPGEIIAPGVGNDNNDPAQAQSVLNNMISNDHIVALVGHNSSTLPTWDTLMQSAGVPVIGDFVPGYEPHVVSDREVQSTHL